MPRLTLALGLCHLAAAFLLAPVSVSGAVPVLNGQFCSDNVDTLTVDGKPRQKINYALCMDLQKLLWWRRDTNSDGSYKETLNNGNGTSYSISYTKDGKAQQCNQTAVPMPSPTSLPFSFIIIDDDAKLNGTVTKDKLQLQRWRVHRPARTVGHFSVPAEDMNWFIHDYTGNDSDNSIKPALIQTDCYEQVNMGSGNVTTDGARDYSNNYQHGQPDESHWVLPKSVACKQIDPPQENGLAFATWKW